MFTKLLLVACICIIVALILYFFFWNRIIAFCIGQIIRVLYWNQEASSIWVEIGSIHFSLPAGRILFKDFRYHSSNQTIKIVKGQLQWRYWIRRPATEEDIAGPAQHKGSEKPLSCRIHISFQGLEWFMYNRTASFDNIVSQMEPHIAHSTSRFSDHHRTKSHAGSATYPPTTTGRRFIPSTVQNAFSWLRRQLPSLDPKDLLPLGIQVTTGALILGNPSTPHLLVAEFQGAEGTFGVVPSRSKYDLYKQSLALKFANPIVRYVLNEEYVESMNSLGAILHDRIERYNGFRSADPSITYKSFSRLWRQASLFELILQYFSERRDQRKFRRTLAAASRPTKGKKVEEAETPIGIDFSTHEYAVEETILEAPSVEVTYFVDVVGEVPPFPHSDPHSRVDVIDVGNGDTAPEWGINLVIRNGFVRYGPWADRQRAELQRAFFPPGYQNIEPTPRLKPGDKRLWTALQIFVELRDETTLHIPFREASKDWQWDGKAEIPKRPKKREHAFLNVSVGDRSSINYLMQMAAGSNGYEPIVEVHLDTISLTSSLNDIKPLTAETCRVRCEQPSPLRWNEPRTWTYSITLRQPSLYLLRDHVNMFTDLGKDWASGPPTDYQKFIPMIYIIKLKLHHYEINLYANDHNIIDKPLLREENALLTARGVDLDAHVTMPSNKFRPPSYAVPFTIQFPNVGIDLSVPRWSTHALYCPPSGNSILKAEGLTITGSYRIHADVHEENVDNLKLEIQVQRVAFKALGWAIRYIMVLRDNYFGSFTHFSTLSEYLGLRKAHVPVGDPVEPKYREGKYNMLQVELTLDVERALIAVPAAFLGHWTSSFQLTGPESDDPSKATGAALLLAIPRLQVYLRLHDYFMEMSANVDCIRGLVDAKLPEKMNYRQMQQRGKEVLYIDGLDVVANRLFGPQPNTSTYLCIWEIHLGRVKASMSAFEAKVIGAAAQAFGIHFTDDVNAPAEQYVPAEAPDITFYKIVITSIEIIWKTPTAALVVCLDEGVKFDSNDLASNHYRKVTSLQVSKIEVKLLVTSASRGPSTSWLEAGEIATDAYIDVYDAPSDYVERNRAQTEYVQEQDKLTGRVRRMVAELRKKGRQTSEDTANAAGSKSSAHSGGMYLPQPNLPSAVQSTKLRPIGKHRRQHSRSHSGKASWRLTQLGQLSDSDGEDALSEADRDARVAKSRFSVSRPIRPPSEEDMSTGDESDDADLTDGDSINSDWSEMAESPNAPAESSLLSFYSPLTRHYYQNQDGSPGLWSGPAFTLAREKSPLKGKRKILGSGSKAFEPMAIGISEESKKDCDTTTLRVRMRRPFEVKLTPLLAVAANRFGDDFAQMPLDPAMLIDSMMKSYTPNLLKDEKPPKFTVMDLGFPSVGFTVFQHISTAHKTSMDTFVSDELPRSQPTKLDSTSVLDVSLTNIHLTLGKVQKEVAFRAAIGGATCSLDISLDKRTLFSSAPALAILNAGISNLQVEFSNTILKACMEGVYGTIGHQGPSIAAATARALLHSTQPLTQNFSELCDERDAVHRQQLCDILLSSQNKPIVDPLSTIQPSYLVQAGVPWRLRSAPGFRLLYHLRSCLDPMAPPTIPQDSGTQEEFLSLMDARLSTLDADYERVEQLPKLRKFLPGVTWDKSAETETTKTLPISGISFDFGKAGLTILDSLGRTATELRVSQVHGGARKEKLELISFSTALPTSMSQTSLREKAPKTVRRFEASFALGEISLAVFPQLMTFVQETLRVRKQYFAKPSSKSPVKAGAEEGFEISKSSKLRNINIVFSLRRLRLRAAAENLVFEVGLIGVQAVSASILSKSNLDPSANHSLVFGEVYLQARSPSSPEKESPHDILAAIALQSGKLNYLTKAGASLPNASHRLTFSLDQFRIDVPRSALRLYRFAEEWQADYLPGIEATVKAMLAEIDKPNKPAGPVGNKPSTRDINIQVTATVSRIGIVLQVMLGTWLTWEVESIVGYLKSPIKNSPVSPTYTFGVQAGSVTLNVSSSKPQEVNPNSGVRLVMPPLSVAGHYDGSKIHTLVLVEFVELKVKPSHWDTLLAVQQKFGQDFTDFLKLVQETRSRRPVPSEKPPPSRSVQYGAFIKMRGFRVGLEGLSSTLYLECVDIGGGMNNIDGLSWDIGLTGLALSLAPRALGGLPYDRRQRTAFVSIDFNIRGNDDNNAETLTKTLDFSVTKIHAVMQASSIGEIGDFIDHLQAEMLERREQRAVELAEFKEKTQRILQTFDVKVREVQMEETTGWLRDYVVNVLIQNIGIAFPLSHDHEVDFARTARDSEAIRAFLFTVKSISFKSDRGVTGEALMQRLCFQFVQRFRQSSPEDFSSDQHHARNCLVYPQMKAQLRTSTTASSRKLWIDATVNGFVLDMDSTIPDYVFSLIDVYRKGKERVKRLATTIPRTPSSADTPQTEYPKAYGQHYTDIPTSNIFASLSFASGKVRAYSGSAIRQFRNRSQSMSVGSNDLTDEQILDLGAEVFNLPTVSVWTEYRATPASQKQQQEKDAENTPASLLIFKCTVHSSRNVLRPQLLPFLTEVMNRVESRMRKISSLSPAFPEADLPTGLEPFPRYRSFTPTPDAVSSLQLSFSLRIDKSRLELTCQPDVNVVAAVNWESGGFTLDISPGARNVTLTGAVGGLTVGLRHGFLSEDCVNIGTRNLTFLISFAKMDTFNGKSRNVVSAILESELLGGVRFSRLQDILCFKAVWLDRIPVLNSYAPSRAQSPPRAVVTPASPDLFGNQDFVTIVLVRIRQVQLTVDLGQSISLTALDLKNVVLRSKVTDLMQEVSIFVEDVTVSAKGNLAGRIHVPQCLFQTIRRSEQLMTQDAKETQTLELKMTSGPLAAVLESDHQKLLHYRAEPLEVQVFDDWSKAPHLIEANRSLQLSFVVSCSEITMAATVIAIPKMMSYANKFKSNLEAQRQGASRESKTYWATRVPKPENPLSAVAEAMIYSARNRFQEMDLGLTFAMRQHMSLKLDLLRLVVFPRSMLDAEIAQFIGRKVSAQFDRLVASGAEPAKRDLRLSFSSMSISKHAQPPQAPPSSSSFDSRGWIDDIFRNASEATIIGLPSMIMHMVSEEVTEADARALVYDFKSRFVRQEGMKAYEDIFITLNMSLYTWLTLLRKNLAREMEQVRAAEDWRSTVKETLNAGTAGNAAAPAASAGGAGSSSNNRGRKVPSPLDLSAPDATAAAPVDDPHGLFSASVSAPNTSKPALALDTGARPDVPRSARLARESGATTTTTTGAVNFPATKRPESLGRASDRSSVSPTPTSLTGHRPYLTYTPRNRHIERLTMRQLGEATPDVMHPFFMKKAGFNLEESLPQYVHEYAAVPLEEIMDVLLKIYSQQLLKRQSRDAVSLPPDSPMSGA